MRSENLFGARPLRGGSRGAAHVPLADWLTRGAWPQRGKLASIRACELTSGTAGHAADDTELP